METPISQLPAAAPSAAAPTVAPATVAPATTAPATTAPAIAGPAAGARPAAAALAGGLALIALAALAKLAIHLATTGLFGYSYFIDELYFLDCARHLAWGFVDMPPLFPAVVAALRAVLGDSLLAVRLLPALCGAALVAMTGLMARDLGGRRFAQGIAALAVLAAPIWLVMHSIDTMNALEQLSWTGCAWIVLRIVRADKQRVPRLATGGAAAEEQGAPRPRLWLLFGAVAGLGMLNKHSMAFFAVAVVAALLLTPERRALRSPWLWLGGLVAGVIFLPNLVWIVQHHFPHFEMLANIKREGRDVALNPLQFMAQQVLMLNPAALPLWLGGLGWLLFGREGRRYRVLGIAWLGVMAEMFLLGGRPYYPAPAYPMLLAAGGVALESWLAAPRWRAAKPAYAAALALSGAALAPLFVPLLPPAALIRYSQATGLSQPRIETHRLGPLPQLMADRFGWKEMAEEVARIYRSLPPADRAKAAIFGQNYGQAGAIDLFGPALGLPQAISGHLSYYLWGPRGYTGEVMIVLDDNRETLERLFESVELAGRVYHPYSMPYEHFDVFVCRGLRQPLAALWPRIKRYE
ncbi:MAG TPA: glycosyltransferase family 39 protein [Thermoanaerobaculia bacterium]|nr:glycosyltransferase family 39 protein [Thermoanaerobaculia bacterium]